MKYDIIIIGAGPGGIYSAYELTKERSDLKIAVFEAVDGDAAKAVQEGMQARLSSQISDYGDYRPQEVPKLESAVVKTSGNYVVLCVSADNDAAADLIEEAF